MIRKLIKTGGLLLMALGLFSACSADTYIIGKNPKIPEITGINAGGGGMEYTSSWSWYAGRSPRSGVCTLSGRMWDENNQEMKEINYEISPEEYESILQSVEGLKYVQVKPDPQVMDGYSESARLYWQGNPTGSWQIDFSKSGMGPLISAFVRVSKAHAELPGISVTVTDNDAWIYAEWESAGEECIYEVSLNSRYESTEGEVSLSRFFSFETEGTSAGLSDYIAWYLQEAHTDTRREPMDLVVSISAKQDDRIIASGESDLLSLQYFFPPQEVPVLKEDILPEEIVLFEWNSSGSSMENIFSFFADMSADPAVYSLSYYSENGYTEDEKEMPEEFTEQLREYIGRGKLYRRYVMDPEIQELDGGEEYFRIEWNGMNEGQRRYYRIEFNEEDEAELTAFLKAAAQQENQ